MANYIVKFLITINGSQKTISQVGIIGEPESVDIDIAGREVEAYFKKFKGNDTVEVKVECKEEVSDEEYKRQLPINIPVGEGI
jgi:hypothetical protein